MLCHRFKIIMEIKEDGTPDRYHSITVLHEADLYSLYLNIIEPEPIRVRQSILKHGMEH